MMFKKIKSGIAPFDNLFQGLYLNRPTLLSGKRKSGASTLVLRFISHVLQIGEKLLLFTEETPDHVTLEAHGLGTDISDALHHEQLCIVPYDRHLPLLPFPEALDELREMISSRHYSFVVLDTAIPWLAAPADRLEERLNAFFGLLDDTAATAVLLLRHPVSPLAKRLFDEVSQRCAICLNAVYTPGNPRSLEVTKYMGAPPEQCPAVIPLGAGSSEPAPYLRNPADSMNLRDLHKAATQRIQVNVPSYLTAGPLPSSKNAAPRGFPAAPAAPVHHAPHPVERRRGEPAVAPLPPAIPLSSLPHAAPQKPASRPSAPAEPMAAPVAPMPSPFHSKSMTQPISVASLLDDPDVAASRRAPPRPAPRVPPRAAPHPIRFADAQTSADRPRETPRAPASAPSGDTAAPPPPPPPPPPPQHPIRFSDIIQ